MKFTFGIISSPATGQYLQAVVDSIRRLEIPECEILIVGGNQDCGGKLIEFDETQIPNWITRKKNLITENAAHENIVYMHDYVSLCEDWYKGFLSFGEDWDVCMNRVTNPDGSRYLDWAAWDDPDLPIFGSGLIREKWCPNTLRVQGGFGGVSYTKYTKTQYMYISGAYWVAKKSFMKRFPLDETLLHCDGEDVEWSYRARTEWKYVMNSASSVRFLKYKPLFHSLKFYE